MKETKEISEFEDKVGVKGSTIVKWVLLAIVIVILLSSFYIIPAGKRGVLLTFGKPSMQAIGEGLHMKIPGVQKVIRMSIQTQKYEADASAASSDLQIINSKIATNYHLVGDCIPKIYQEIGLGYADVIIQPMEQEVVKAVTARHPATELITNREIARLEMKELMYERLLPRCIVVEEVSIVNFKLSDEYDNAIEQKAVALQLKLKAQTDLERIIIEKEQIITQAEGQAEAQRLQKLQLTPELVTMRALQVQELAIQKWDGKLPAVTGGATPFVSLSGLTNNSAF